MTQPIAVLAFWKNYDRKLYLRAAQLADELGYHSFWAQAAPTGRGGTHGGDRPGGESSFWNCTKSGRVVRRC